MAKTNILKAGRPWTRKRHSAMAAWIFTTLLLLYLLAVAFLIPDPTQGQIPLIRFFMALLGGFSAFFFVGDIALKGQIFGQRIATGGGFALFVLIQVLADPFAVRQLAGDHFPDAVRPDEYLKVAQVKLKTEGLLNKTPDGIRDTETTNAIRRFQASHNLPQNGILTRETVINLQSSSIRAATLEDSAGRLSDESSDNSVVPVPASNPPTENSPPAIPSQKVDSKPSPPTGLRIVQP